MTKEENIEKDSSTTEGLKAMDLFRGNDSEAFVSYRAPLQEIAAQARKDIPRLYDYSDGYKDHLEAKRIHKPKKEEKVIIDVAPQPARPQGMTNLMSLIENEKDDEALDILNEIRKDFVDPYEKESASTVIMPASELLEAAKRELDDPMLANETISVPLIRNEEHFLELAEVFLKVNEEWEEQKDNYTDKHALQRFEIAVIDTTDEIRNRILNLPTEDETQLNEWIQGKLLPILDEISLLYSLVYDAAYSGDMKAARIRNWLQELLFSTLNDCFIKMQWFMLDMIIPFQSEFDSREHFLLDRRDRGPEFRNCVITINHVGLFNAEGSERIRQARVVIGA
ncbi:MAG: hypothetical protein VX278_18340 [Myxococcota bacterium]|nr:hypothetical protein [Myxococcota bacterium]